MRFLDPVSVLGWAVNKKSVSADVTQSLVFSLNRSKNHNAAAGRACTPLNLTMYSVGSGTIVTATNSTAASALMSCDCFLTHTIMGHMMASVVVTCFEHFRSGSRGLVWDTALQLWSYVFRISGRLRQPPSYFKRLLVSPARGKDSSLFTFHEVLLRQ